MLCSSLPYKENIMREIMQKITALSEFLEWENFQNEQPLMDDFFTGILEFSEWAVFKREGSLSFQKTLSILKS